MTMTRTGVRAMLMAMILVLLWQWSGGVVTAAAFSRLVVFGDSLPDPGNAFVLQHTSAVPPFELIPDASYARGGHHFSNGATWVEQLGTTLGLNPSPGPAFQKPIVFSNYAVGGSRARTVLPCPGPISTCQINLTVQVKRFLADFGPVAPDDALYVVHIGGDDLGDALVAFPTTNPPGLASSVILGEALAAIGANIVALAEAGASTFLVPNVPDLALVPAVRLAGSGAQLAGTGLADGFNTQLDALLDGLERTLGVKIFRLDIFTLLHAVVANPAAFGLTEVETPCITPGTLVHPFCSQPDRFLFWDGIHPTRAGHGIISSRALDVLSAP
jgi:outer membrane lipase/esterase